MDVPGTHEYFFHTGIEALALTFCVLCLVLKECLSSFNFYDDEGERLCVVPGRYSVEM